MNPRDPLAQLPLWVFIKLGSAFMKCYDSKPARMLGACWKIAKEK